MSKDPPVTNADALMPDNAKATLRWPPPGLERLHRGVWPVNTLLGVGGVLMTVPMLWALSSRPPFWSPGPFGEAWWLPAIASLAGLVLVMTALVRAGLLLRAAARAADIGYDGRTIAYVVCDATRDAGFLLQGLRQYADLGEPERHRLLEVRVIAAFAYATALLWIPVAFTFGVLLAARGAVNEVGTLWALVFVPAGLLATLGLCARGFDGLVTLRARAIWRSKGTGEAETRRDAVVWLTARTAQFGHRFANTGGMRGPRLAAVGFGALALVLPLPIILLVGLSAVGPILTRTLSPGFNATSWRIARTEMLRPYALPADSSISAMEAGETLQVLAYVGRPDAQRSPLERAPVRTLAKSWLADMPESIRSPDLLVPRVLEQHEPLTDAERAWLERAAEHPGHAEIARLARAPRADFAGARWNASALADTNMWDLPIVRFSEVINGTNVHLALGLLEADRGNRAAAEIRFLDVISVGLLLAGNGPSLIDILVGSRLAQNGANALRLFYESSGRVADANAIRLALEGVERAETRARSLQPPRIPVGSLRGMMEITANADVPPGVRWETLNSTRFAAACANPNAALFGPGDGYNQWLDEMHTSLVRFPSDEALFQLIGNDLVVPERMRDGANLAQRLIRLTFGDTGPAGSCATFATALAAAY